MTNLYVRQDLLAQKEWKYLGALCEKSKSAGSGVLRPYRHKRGITGALEETAGIVTILLLAELLKDCAGELNFELYANLPCIMSIKNACKAAFQGWS